MLRLYTVALKLRLMFTRWLNTITVTLSLRIRQPEHLIYNLYLVYVIERLVCKILLT